MDKATEAPDHRIPDTLLRISVLGPLTIEWVTEDGKISPIPIERLSGRGAAPALGLLKALLSQPDRFATRDWLIEQFWPDSSVRKAEERLDDVASGLRSLLRHPGQTTKHIHYVYGSDGKGGGYRLDAYPLIWVDTDAFVWYVKQAARFERFGQDAFPLWESAYQLAARGTYLPEEPYSDWAQPRRDIIAGHYRQCVHRLTSLLRERGAHEQAALFLRTYWQEHKSDEDALRVLMELLGEQERYQEAEECFQQLILILAEQGPNKDGIVCQPDARTLDMREYIRGKQLCRPTEQQAGIYTSKSLLSPSYESHNSTEIFSSLEKQPPSNASRRDLLQSFVGFANSATISAVLAHLEVGDYESSQKRSNTILTLHSPQQVSQETLQDFSTLIEICRRFSEGNDLNIAEQMLWSYLPYIEAIAKSSFPHQAMAADITAQGYLLAASLVGHRNDLQLRQWFSEQALLYSELANNPSLQVAALRQLAVTFNYSSQAEKVLDTYQRALPLLEKVPPRLRACIYAALSGVCAKKHQKQEAQHYIRLANAQSSEQDKYEPSYLRTVNASSHLVLLWEGLNYLALGQPRTARQILLQMDTLKPTAKIPERIRAEFLNCQARSLIAVDDLEQSYHYLESAIEIATTIGSRRRFQESFTVFQQMKARWPEEQQTKDMGDLLLQRMINQMQ